MCGTFSQNKDGKVIRDAWIREDIGVFQKTPLKLLDAEIPAEPDLFAAESAEIIRYPTQSAWVLHTNHSSPTLQLMRWGLIPQWWDSPQGPGKPWILAREETAAQKPVFRDAWEKGRCVVPIERYWEWTEVPVKRCFEVRPQPKISWAAAIMSPAPKSNVSENRQTRSASGSAEEFKGGYSFAFLTIPSLENPEIAPLHPRMLHILKSSEDIEKWLNGYHFSS